MEEHLKSSVDFGNSIDLDDSNYLCGLSTILVATIQELKDRTSQIEFIFCSQLFPNIQARSNLLQNKLAEARKSLEDEWKKKETSLLSQIEELRFEKQQAQEEVHQLNISLEQSKRMLMTAEQSLAKHEYENKQLLAKVEILKEKEEIIAELKLQLRDKSAELAKEKGLPERLLQQIELKDQQLVIEQKKRRCLYEEFNAKYKQLKSQYNFLVRRSGLTLETKHSSGIVEEETDLPSPSRNKRALQDCGYTNRETIRPDSKVSAQNTFHVKLEEDRDENQSAQDRKDTFHVKLEEDRDENQSAQDRKDTCDEKFENVSDIGFIKKSIAASCIKPPASHSLVPPKYSIKNSKSEPSSGQKKGTSCWRNTRARQEPVGADPHDDFLDTPMELVRNLSKGPQEEAQDFPLPASKEMDFDKSDVETQVSKDNEPLIQQNNIFVHKPANKSFKFVEPIRKKAERENLKGVECKQCRKFYDAVLPNGRDGMRCEHHDGVSRHRYRYAPPLTPEGFWNIGFDSDV